MFDIESAKREGYSDEDIASYLAQSKQFDLQGALREGYSHQEITNHLSQSPTTPTFFDAKPVVEGIKPAETKPVSTDAGIFSFLKKLGPREVVSTPEGDFPIETLQKPDFRQYIKEQYPGELERIEKEPKTFSEGMIKQTEPIEALKWGLSVLPIAGPKILEKIGIIRGAKEAERLRPVAKPYATLPITPQKVTQPIGLGLKTGIEVAKPVPKQEIPIAPQPKPTPQPIPTSQPTLTPPSIPTVSSLETIVKGGQTGPLPKYAEKSSINLERLDTTDDIKHFINNLTKEQELKIGKRKVTWDETRQKAEELGWDVDEVKKAFQKKGSFSAAEIEATRQVNINAITDLHEMLRTLPAERVGYTPEMRAKVLDAIDSVRVTSQASSEAGRALNIHKKILARDEQFKEVSQMNRVLKTLEGKGVGRTDDVIDALKNIDFTNTSEVNRFIYNTTKTKWQKMSDMAYEIWINGLLSNPLTHIVNTTSNTLTLMGQYPERLLGAGIEKARSGLGVFGGKTQERFMGESAQDAFSIIQGVKTGTKRFLDAIKTGKMSETKLETHVSALPPSVQKFTPGRALGAEDEFFKGFIENAELNRLAYRKATQEGLSGKGKADRITSLLSTPTEEMLETAASRGKYLTYQQDLGKVGSWIIRGRQTVPGLKYFIPFVRTPTNIVKFALERTPANIPRIAYKVAKGELAGGALSEDVAKVLTGSMLGLFSYLVAKEGNITGGGPKGSAERDELFRSGWLPYSIKVGDKFYSFARLEPLASILGISADFAELEKHMKEDEKIKVASAIGTSISKNFTSKTFMQGFSNLNDAISDPGRFGEKFVQNLAGSVVPAISGGITRAIDPEIREVKGILDTIRSRIPGVSEMLPEKLNVWGYPIERPGSPVLRFISPVQVSETKGDPIDIELLNLKINLGMPSKKIKNIELEPNEYRQMVVDAGRVAKPELNKIVQTSWYKKLSDEEKEKEVRKVMGEARKDARDIAFILAEKRIGAIPKISPLPPGTPIQMQKPQWITRPVIGTKSTYNHLKYESE